MAEICAICGLPRDLCVCGEISKDQQKIKVRLERRKSRKFMTIIDGINGKDVDLGDLAKRMKTLCACGGTAKEGQIMLQGDQREKIHGFLIEFGYPENNIEIQ